MEVIRVFYYVYNLVSAPKLLVGIFYVSILIFYTKIYIGISVSAVMVRGIKSKGDFYRSDILGKVKFLEIWTRNNAFCFKSKFS